MKHKMKITLVAFLAAIVSACGSVGDLSVTPFGVASAGGVAAGVAWCDERDRQISSLYGVRYLVGGAIDTAAIIASAPVVAATGKTVIQGTTAIRDAQCASLRAGEKPPAGE